jgi:thymidylate synthase
MKSLSANNFDEVIEWLTIQLANAPDVEVGEWQAIRDDRAQTRTIEAQDLSFSFPLPLSDAPKIALQIVVQPNLPWAEDHFLERVSGAPLNPPPSHSWWPYAQADNAEHTDVGKFSHTYPERIWPKFAESLAIRSGIRFEYGDLNDVIELLRQRPATRQAFLPIWFPEDGTAALAGARVPCTLGYHFLIRGGRLKIVYYIRSCDFYRHFRDDVYMTGRLAQWVADKVGVATGDLVMHISSLHIFSAERAKIRAEMQHFVGNSFGKFTW